MAGTNIFSIMIKKISEKNNDGVSPVIATILLVAITVIVCGIVAAFVMSFNNQLDEQTGEIMVIKFIDIDKAPYAGSKTYSNITVQNLGRKYLVNSDYQPVIYINGTLHPLYDPGPRYVKKLNARVNTATGLNSISGPGPEGSEWEPGAIGYFDLTNGAINQTSVVQLDIIRNSDGKLFSRSVRVHN